MIEPNYDNLQLLKAALLADEMKHDAIQEQRYEEATNLRDAERRILGDLGFDNTHINREELDTHIKRIETIINREANLDNLLE